MIACANNDEVNDDEEQINEVENFTTAYGKYDKEEKKLELNKALNVWKETPMFLGITGRSGVGKSSLINTIRGITADDDGAAKTGVVETTEKVRIYTHPKNEQLRICDLPGVGTRKFPKSTYFTDKDIGIDKFDMFIILTADRFFEDDVWLAKEIRSKNKMFLFARTKIHQDVENERKSKPRLYSENPKEIQKTLDSIRTNCKESLREFFGENELDQVLYLIDNYEIDKYDMDKLMDKLIEGFPDMKRDALVLSLSPLTPSVIAAKAKSLRKRIWKVSFLSGIVGAIPIPGTSLIFDVPAIFIEAKFYQEQLGLGEKNLKVTAEKMKLNYVEFVKLTKMSAVSLAITHASLMACLTALSLSTALAISSKFVPIIGSIVGAPLSFSSTFAILELLLKKMVNDSKSINAYIADYNSKQKK